MKKLILLIALAPVALSAQITLDSTTIEMNVVAENLKVPWEILWGPNDHIWVTERDGLVKRVDPTSGSAVTVADIDDVAQWGEGGLLGMVLHPDFSVSPYVYLVYNFSAGAFTLKERLVRYTYDNDSLISPLILLDSLPGANNHNGSRLLIHEGKLYMTTGDYINTASSQDLSDLGGKTLRMNLDGSIPSDNPIPGSLIWSWGHRNAQGLIVGTNGIMYSSEHGPQNDDELNIIIKGANYGWPNVHGFCDQAWEMGFCNDSNVVEPIEAWTPTLAVCGIDFYDSDAIPEWRNSVLLANLKEDDLRILHLNSQGDAIDSEEVFFNNDYGRLRDVCVDPQGNIYIATSNRDGRGNGGFPVVEDDRIIKISNVAVGLQEIGDQAFSVYPNPASETLNIELPNTIVKGSVSILDISGRVLPGSKTFGVQHGAFSLDISSLSSGTYLIEIESETYIKQSRFVKK